MIFRLVAKITKTQDYMNVLLVLHLLYWDWDNRSCQLNAAGGKLIEQTIKTKMIFCYALNSTKTYRHTCVFSCFIDSISQLRQVQTWWPLGPNTTIGQTIISHKCKMECKGQIKCYPLLPSESRAPTSFTTMCISKDMRTDPSMASILQRDTDSTQNCLDLNDNLVN